MMYFYTTNEQIIPYRKYNNNGVDIVLFGVKMEDGSIKPKFSLPILKGIDTNEVAFLILIANYILYNMSNVYSKKQKSSVNVFCIMSFILLSMIFIKLFLLYFFKSSEPQFLDITLMIIFILCLLVVFIGIMLIFYVSNTYYYSKLMNQNSLLKIVLFLFLIKLIIMLIIYFKENQHKINDKKFNVKLFSIKNLSKIIAIIFIFGLYLLHDLSKKIDNIVDDFICKLSNKYPELKTIIEEISLDLLCSLIQTTEKSSAINDILQKIQKI